MLSIAPHRNDNASRPKSEFAKAAIKCRARRSGRLYSRNGRLAILLASVAVLGFATVIFLAVMLRYGKIHHLLAGY